MMNLLKIHCLAWDTKRLEYGTLTSPWKDADIKKLTPFEVKERFWTKSGATKAMQRKKTEQMVKKIENKSLEVRSVLLEIRDTLRKWQGEGKENKK